jgi:hypothetical protein
VKYRSCGGNAPGTDIPRSATLCFAFGFASSQGKSIKWERRSQYLPRAFCFLSRHHGLLSMLGESHQSESLSRGSPLSVRSAKVYDGSRFAASFIRVDSREHRLSTCNFMSCACCGRSGSRALGDLRHRGSRCGESLGQYISSWELGDLCTGDLGYILCRGDRRRCGILLSEDVIA